MSDFDLEQKPSRRLWILAALGALALHLGGAALAIAHLQSDGFDEGLGANGVEIAFEMASPKVTHENAPEAEKARAPNLGIGKDKQKLAADWGRQISAYFELHKRYPKVKKNKST